MLGILFQDAFPTIPSQIFRVVPFPLMIFTLVLIDLSRSRGKKSSLLLRLFSGAPPDGLGRNYRPS